MTRKVTDGYGSIELAQDVSWGVNTERSRQNFPIGTELQPEPLIRALIQIKQAASSVNGATGGLSEEKSQAIKQACQELLALPDLMVHFPLVIWQTGSGTQTNMNVNEVISSLASTAQLKIHPNDDVNQGQSSNDVYPAALHLFTLTMLEHELIPALTVFKQTLLALEQAYPSVIKTARTHLQDATPIKFSQVVSAWRAMIETGINQILDSYKYLMVLPLGATAVGTGLNSWIGYPSAMAETLSQLTGFALKPSDNLFHAISTKDGLVFLTGALNALAGNLFKLANDIRFLASGPKTGLKELILPANEAGSSIMPGKVNPTQNEALMMVTLQVMGNLQTISLANSQGNFELNTFMPLIGYNLWQALRLLTDGVNSFNQRCLSGLKPNLKVMEQNLAASLMTATWLNQRFGYDQVTKIVQQAEQTGQSLKAVVIELGLMSSAEFDDFFDYNLMVQPQVKKQGAEHD